MFAFMQLQKNKNKLLLIKIVGKQIDLNIFIVALCDFWMVYFDWFTHFLVRSKWWWRTTLFWRYGLKIKVTSYNDVYFVTSLSISWLACPTLSRGLPLLLGRCLLGLYIKQSYWLEQPSSSPHSLMLSGVC